MLLLEFRITMRYRVEEELESSVQEIGGLEEEVLPTGASIVTKPGATAPVPVEKVDAVLYGPLPTVFSPRTKTL